MTQTGNRLRIENILSSSILPFPMKFPLFALSFLATVLTSLPVGAQELQPSQKQLKAKEPVELVPPETPGITAPYVDPTTQVRDFFRQLGEGRVDAAYDQLLRGTKIAEIPKDVMTLKGKTRDAIRAFGDIGGYEIASAKNIGRGAHLMCLTCVSLGKQFPIRWRFYFYNPTFKIAYPQGTDPVIVNGTWKLIDIRIDDRLMDMFEEPAAITSGSAK